MSTSATAPRTGPNACKRKEVPPEPHPPRRLDCPEIDKHFCRTMVGGARERPPFPELRFRRWGRRGAVRLRCMPLPLAYRLFLLALQQEARYFPIKRHMI